MNGAYTLRVRVGRHWVDLKNMKSYGVSMTTLFYIWTVSNPSHGEIYPLGLPAP
jgi:hypothetical protein